MKNLTKILALSGIVTTIMLTGCGNNKSASEVVGTHVPSNTYSAMSCADLKVEYSALEKSVVKSANAVDTKKNSQDNKDMAAALLFFPALAFTDENTEEVSRHAEIKGKYEAIKNVFINKCIK
ncbi:hypothetical protein MNB_SUP05-SYMBIONT-4-449 [hydrothermal vent metagenome]|uniref:Lipoprotein n=1 Tax=hydrothermal vent metagenome TaxID=652676 RepID=A0A1W1DW73_9ZZZZ